MKRIKLTKGLYTTVDVEDYPVLMTYKWCAALAYGDNYIAMTGASKTHGRKAIKLHRLITNAPVGKVVDHINGDTLDNRKVNLRVCTHRENMRNRKPTIGASKYKGVTYHKVNKKWIARINTGDERKYLGTFTTEKEANDAYTEAAEKYHREFAYHNRRG